MLSPIAEDFLSISPPNNYGYQAFRKKGQELLKQTPRKDRFEAMSLDECKAAKDKYLDWIAKNPTHPQASVQTHLYEQYLLPRLEQLQFEENVITGLTPPLSIIELQDKLPKKSAYGESPP